MPDNQPIPSTRGTDRHDRPLVHPAVARGGAYAWRLIGIGIVGWAALQLLTALWVLVLTGAVAVLLGRALDPVANVFRRRGLRPALVAVVTLGGFLLVMAGIMALLVPAIVDEFSDLGPTLEESIDDLEDWLVDDSPFDISRTDIREFRETAGDRVSETLESQGGTVVSGTVVAFEVITGLVLAMIATFFLLKDGDKFGRWLLTFMPDGAPTAGPPPRRQVVADARRLPAGLGDPGRDRGHHHRLHGVDRGRGAGRPRGRHHVLRRLPALRRRRARRRRRGAGHARVGRGHAGR